MPSIFKAFPAHLQKATPKTRLRKKRKLEVNAVEVVPEKEELLTHIEPEAEPGPTTQKKMRQAVSPKTQRLRKKIKVLNQKVRRQNKKIHSLQDLLRELRKKGLIQRDCSNIIEHHFDGALSDIIKNEVLNRKRNVKGRRYSKDLKHFALTLLYYSPRAYTFCR